MGSRIGKLSFLFFFAVLPGASVPAGEPFSRGLLWEVSRPGTPASYVFGTMHTADPRLLEMSPAAEKAFSAARTLVIEMHPDDAATGRFAEASELPAGQDLAGLMPPERYGRLRGILSARGIDASRIERSKPWAALLLLTELPAEAGPGPEPSSVHSLDIELFARARVARKPIEALDSVEEQIAVFDDLPIPTQLGLLEVALDRYEHLMADQEQRIAAYRRGDLAQLMRLARHFPGASADSLAHLDLLEKKIVRDRSVVMAHRVQSTLRRGRAFVAVGALHLYGRQGMLHLLKEDGWRVRQVITGKRPGPGDARAEKPRHKSVRKTAPERKVPAG